MAVARGRMMGTFELKTGTSVRNSPLLLGKAGQSFMHF